MDQIDDLSNAYKKGKLESSAFALKAEVKAKLVVEVTGVSGPSDVEDIGDRLLLVEAGCDKFRGARTYEAEGPALYLEKAILEDGVWLSEPLGRSWVKEDQQSAALLAPSGLAEDVFMGFPGSQGL